MASISYPCFKIGFGCIDFENAQLNKAISFTPTSSWLAVAVQSHSSWLIVFLIYFTYTCDDIHIISCCDILTPDAGRFIQAVHANLHSYHARMGRASRQWSALWPKKANTQAKTWVDWIKSALWMDSVICRSSDFTGAWTLMLCNLFMSGWHSGVSPAESSEMFQSWKEFIDSIRSFPNKRFTCSFPKRLLLFFFTLFHSFSD